MLGYPEFHHDLIEKYVSVFGSLFANIELYRSGLQSGSQELVKVPLSRGSRDKVLAFADKAFKSDPMAVATITPRIAFDYKGLELDSARQLNKRNNICTVAGVVKKIVPYNFTFELSILTKTDIEAQRIVEQILPFFDPSITVSIKPFAHDPSAVRDVTIVYNGAQVDDSYQGNPEDRRNVVWTLMFTLKADLYGPVTTDQSVIKLININYFPALDADTSEDSSQIYPGLTASGVGTTDPDEAIPYDQVDADDPYSVIIKNGA